MPTKRRGASKHRHSRRRHSSRRSVRGAGKKTPYLDRSVPGLNAVIRKLERTNPAKAAALTSYVNENGTFVYQLPPSGTKFAATLNPGNRIQMGLNQLPVYTSGGLPLRQYSNHHFQTPDIHYGP